MRQSYNWREDREKYIQFWTIRSVSGVDSVNQQLQKIVFTEKLKYCSKIIWRKR